MLRIKYEMEQQGVSQAKLAEMTGCNRASINRIVNGKEPPYSKRGARIAEALGWSSNPSDLFTEIEV